MDDLALTDMGLGDKAAALALSNGPWLQSRSRKTPWMVPIRSRSSPAWQRRLGDPIAPSPLYRNFFRYRTRPVVQTCQLTPALLRLDPMFDPLRNDPRFQKLVASPAPKKP